jgi:hypothetical protein
MKCTIKFLALFFGVLMLTTAANAESPREQLTQMVEQLKRNPADNALREKIIRLAQEIKPVPAVPDAAVEFEGRAQFAFKNAKSNDDFLAAAREYEKAVVNAPWLSGYYSDLCTIYEKAGKFQDAKRNCEFYLIGLTDSEQITDVKRRIAGLKYGIEQNSPESIAAKKREDSAKRGVAGFWQIQSSRTVYSNPNVTQIPADGVWADLESQREYRITYEFRKVGDSYEIDVLTGFDTDRIKYGTKKADNTTIEYGRTDGTVSEDYRCEIEGEGLFCKRTFSERGAAYIRQEERFARRESCVTGPKDVVGRISARCR